MSALNTVKVEFQSHSANEAFARSCAACFFASRAGIMRIIQTTAAASTSVTALRTRYRLS